MKKIIPQFIKNFYHFGKAVWAGLFFVFPGKKIKVIGVTGTNGKTTTCQMITKILEKSGKKVALASTINFKLGEREWVNTTKFTTLSAWSIQKFLTQAVRKKCEYAVLEVSSHSLDQNRVWGIPFYVAVITNITREHLDYHKTMDNYRSAKLKLFRKSKVAIINLDIENPKDFLSENMEKAYGYATSEKNPEIKLKVLQAKEIRLRSDGSEFEVDKQEFRLQLPGKFNIENALAATCVGICEGIKLKNIAEALSEIKSVPGRLESVPNNQGINIIIDYAVTPDSLQKLYEYVGEIKGQGKVLAVFGSCGERDRGKRPIMGGIVDEATDYIILTNEDPFFEDPWQIINEVAVGIKKKKENENFWKIMDRREAIAKALQLAKSGDFVLVTGKGAEETMAVGKERIPWNDKLVILEEMEKRKSA